MGTRILQTQKIRKCLFITFKPRLRYDEGMHILIDVRLLSRGGTTGIPGYTQHLISVLLKNPAEHTFTLFYNAFRKEHTLPAEWKRYPHVTVVEHHIPNRLLSLFIRLTGHPSIERLTHVPAPDLIWSPHLDLLTTTKTPRVITVHDLSFLHFPSFFSRKYKLWSWLQSQVAQAKTATHLIAVSEYTKHDLSATLAIPDKNIDVTHPGIDHAAFYPLQKNDASLQDYLTRNGLCSPYILFLGTLEPRKNIMSIVRGFATLKQNPRFASYKLVLAGRPGFGFAAITKAIRSYGLSNDVVLLGAVRDEERVYLYNGARAFVFASFFEGFGFPPLEAQACGTPVASTLRGSLAEILNGSCASFDPWQPTSLARALSRIEGDEDYRNKLIAQGIINASRFTWEATAEKTLAVFEHVYRQSKKST